MINSLEKKFKAIQSTIYSSFQNLEDSNTVDISNDSWTRPEGGGGKTIVIADGSFFDNCAINYSSIYGKKLPKAALANSLLLPVPLAPVPPSSDSDLKGMTRKDLLTTCSN